MYILDGGNWARFKDNVYCAGVVLTGCRNAAPQLLNKNAGNINK